MVQSRLVQVNNSFVPQLDTTIFRQSEPYPTPELEYFHFQCGTTRSGIFYLLSYNDEITQEGMVIFSVNNVFYKKVSSIKLIRKKY